MLYKTCPALSFLPVPQVPSSFPILFQIDGTTIYARNYDRKQSYPEFFSSPSSVQ